MSRDPASPSSQPGHAPVPIALRGLLLAQAPALALHTLAVAPQAPQPGTLAAGWFNPVHPLPLQVLGGAAWHWLQNQAAEEAGRWLRQWHARGVAALILDAEAARVAALRTAVAAAGVDAWTSALPAPRLLYALRRLLAEVAAPVETLHGVFLEVEGLGVLLRGASGQGKSELALELIGRGQRLIADDAVEFQRLARGCVIGRCPELLRDLVEVRGLGILNVRAMYGDSAVAARARLDLVIDLGPRADPSAGERLSGRRGHCQLLGETIPEISLPRRVGHNLAVLVEAACRDHRLRLAGYHADADLVARQDRALRDRPEAPSH
jgi:HPr kinase/phosphorylase